MTNAAQSVTNLTNHHRPVAHGEAPAPRVRATPRQADKLLPLTGGVPQTVCVAFDEIGIPVFWQEGSHGRYSGIWWQSNGYALMITFLFVPPLTVSQRSVGELIPVTPALWFSDTVPQIIPSTAPALPSSQMCCVPPISGEYHFAVVPADGTLADGVDPRIVVTPIVST